jgi:hypothetical protein
MFNSVPDGRCSLLVHEDKEITREQAAGIAAYIIETFDGQ